MKDNEQSFFDSSVIFKECTWQVNPTMPAVVNLYRKKDMFQGMCGPSIMAETEFGLMYSSEFIPHKIIDYKRGVPFSMAVFDIEGIDINSEMESKFHADHLLKMTDYYVFTNSKFWKNFHNVETQEILELVSEIEEDTIASSMGNQEFFEFRQGYYSNNFYSNVRDILFFEKAVNTNIPVMIKEDLVNNSLTKYSLNPQG